MIVVIVGDIAAIHTGPKEIDKYLDYVCIHNKDNYRWYLSTKGH